MDKTARRILALPLLLLLPAAAPAAGQSPSDDAFTREDWIATGEPTHPSYWGIQWSVNNFYLPYRALQRGKHELETRYADNWRFGGESGGPGGMFLRFLLGTGLDFGLMQGSQNMHHVAGHDAAAREFDQAFGDGREVPRRFRQVLPAFLGGRPLDTAERQPTARGADANARAMVQPMEGENTFAYASGKDLLADGTVNSMAVARYLCYRGRFFMDLTELGALSQDFINSQTPPFVGPRQNGPGLSTDFTWYLYYLNKDRYGVQRVDDYKLKMGDIKQAFFIQLADPLMWSALYAHGRDYVARGANTSRLPMISLGEDLSYLPSLRVFFSPFGIEYFQDNYLRREGVLANLTWAVGDNRYESRVGGGFDVQGIPLPHRGRLGLFAAVHRQPLLSRIATQGALSPAEVGLTHIAYNFGGSLQVPIWTFDRTGDDPRRLFLYGRGGTKNLGWIPGEYLSAGFYLQTGFGLRL